MRALTLHPEWIPPICSDRREAKRTENRFWRLPSTMVNVPVALHSGARIGGGDGWRPGDPVVAGSRWKNRSPVIAARLNRAAIMTLQMLDAAADAGWPVQQRITARITERWGEAPPTPPLWAQMEALCDLAHPGHVVAVIRFSGCDREVLTAWDAPEQWHWRISDVVLLPQPVPCQGAEKFWELPPPVHSAVRAQLTRAAGS